MNMNIRNTNQISQFCDVISQHPDSSNALVAYCKDLSEDIGNTDRFADLAIALYRSFAFNGCIQFTSLADDETPDLQSFKRLLIGSCHSMLGQSEETKKQFDDLGTVNPSGKYVSQVLEEIYQSANICFNQDEKEAARKAYNLVLPYDSRLHGVSKGTLGQVQEVEESLDDEVEVLCRRLKDMALRGLPDLEQQPTVAQELDKVTPAKIDSLRGQKLLLVLRDQVHKESKLRKCEIVKNFQETAQTVGMEVYFFSGDPFIHYWMFDDAARVNALKQLAKVISEFRPDALVFDNLCSQVADTVVTPHIYGATLAKLKEIFGFKLIALYPDAYEEQCTWAANFSAEFADTIWCLSHQAYLKFEPATQAKTSVIPFPFPFPYPYPDLGIDIACKDIDAAFVGTSKRYNYLRSLWFLAMEDAQIPYELFLTDPEDKPGRLNLSSKEYAALLSRIRCCIQFAARDPETKVLCGRVWESMMSGCALVEEENIETKELLVPYLHYIPFNSIRELAVALACLKKYPELREDIARRGYGWVHRLLNAEKLWAHILCRE